MGKIIQFLIIVMSISIYICCTKDNISPTNRTDELINSSWQFVAFDSAGVIIKVDIADTIYLTFKSSKLIEGEAKGLCNNKYNGIFYLDNNKIRIDSLISTEAACPDSRYWDYFLMLQNVNSFCIDDLCLYMYSYDDSIKLIFERR